ncbi:PDE9A [Symbiodinium necroappetens]|uniref:PDE9A protein n=1 Tax=Symbiodinium necroappetens TaxID=1628268 RepID=A0A813A804_9DINO|nr:PDE9A [Symbiodinium necroappetens]
MMFSAGKGVLGFRLDHQIAYAKRASPSKQKRDGARAVAHRRHLEQQKEVAVSCRLCRKPGRSSSSRASARKRRLAWLAWRSDRHADLPQDKLWVLDRLRIAAETGTSAFGAFVSTFAPQKSVGRQRDCFPLATIAALSYKPPAFSTLRWAVLREFVNFVIAALNWLFGVSKTTRACQPHTGAQQSVIEFILDRVLSTLGRLQEVVPGSWEHHLPDFVPWTARPAPCTFQELEAGRVDNLSVAATCDPLPHLPPHVQDVVTSAKSMFQDAPCDLASFEKFSAGAREEYAKLVTLQLRCGKLGLATSCSGGGTSFTVGKPGGNRLREVWHGRRVSQAAQVPPKPRHLASPTALSFLECSKDRPLRVSKRDASCWFDQLELPASLRLFMAKPAVSTDELVKAGMTCQEQLLYMEAGHDWQEGQLFPVHHVWPMGFAWSSYIAQEVMLMICSRAGIQETSLLACDCETPSSFRSVAAVATDDVMFFSDAGPGVTRQAANAFDDEMTAQGALRNAKKDVNDQLNATCVGVDLVSGCYLDIPGRLLALLITFLFLSTQGRASPKQVHQLLGTLQWYDLLVRPKLSIYEAVYKFTGNKDDDVVVAIPPGVLAELACSLCLGVFWRCDLTRPFLPLLAATDASTEFGFGASVLQAPVSLVRQVARWAEKQGAFLIMDGGTATKSRLGPCHRLGVRLDQFSDIFSVRKKFSGHINVLEGEAFVLYLRWLLRARKHHGRRVVVLLDSAVWLGAAAKGRSSSQLNRLLRKVAALTLAGNLQLNLILVPSAENPSDAPSRGVRRRRKK